MTETHPEELMLPEIRDVLRAAFIGFILLFFPVLLKVLVFRWEDSWTGSLWFQKSWRVGCWPFCLHWFAHTTPSLKMKKRKKETETERETDLKFNHQVIESKIKSILLSTYYVHKPSINWFVDCLKLILYVWIVVVTVMHHPDAPAVRDLLPQLLGILSADAYCRQSLQGLS